MLTGKCLDGENHTRSVILESMVVERSYVYTPRSLFSIILLHCGGVERISLLSSAFCTQKDRKQHSKQSGGVRRTEKAGEVSVL